MKTKIIKKTELLEAAIALRKGNTVVFPTETVYGLGADAFNVEAIKKIFIAKGRPEDNPLIVHVSSKKQVKLLVTEVPEVADKLMDEFWPGPLTLVMKKSKLVSDFVTAGLDTVAIRMPDNEIALKLIELSGVPIAAPSANISGSPSPTSEEHVIDDLNGKVEYIILGGDTVVGLESTVLDVTEKPYKILRPGFITLEDIEDVVGEVSYDKHLIDSGFTPKSPGLKYKHYSPKADIIIVSSDDEMILIEKINELIKEYEKNGKLVGIMVTEELIEKFKSIKISLGSKDKLDVVGNRLFRALRDFDKKNVDVIITQDFKNEGFGVAIMNRLKKASSNKIVYCNKGGKNEDRNR